MILNLNIILIFENKLKNKFLIKIINKLAKFNQFCPSVNIVELMYRPSCPNFYNFELTAGEANFTTSYPQCTLYFNTDFLF
jgi:hypothetical protein